MRYLIIFVFLFSTYTVVAQKKITTRNISDEIEFASVDRVGELYLITKKGQIQKFDVNGKLLSVYKNEPVPTLFEPRDGSRLFAFFRTSRKFEYWNPSFEATNSFLLDSAFIIDPWLACSSGDHNLWILDAADQTIKKYNPRKSILETDVKFPETISPDFSNIIFIREYQGFIFFLDREKGIHIFNGMGKVIKSIAVQRLSYFNFVGEELYYPVDGQLRFLNLFTGEERTMKLPGEFTMALLTDERLFLIQTNSVDFFEFKP
ncbi:hypothetical protein [Chryseolinea sp. H1M3-3]|uniref:hypothetical protein n=1 Tax=Chryseolinea sp. H1M3-3 TaxID=3034144 RepID=UPI0023EDA572|nr:hypothetical protein [Chryseolinea sp. H1M3-3]